MAGPAKRWHLDVGLFILRVGIGAAFVVHGWHKVMAGPDEWEKMGRAMEVFGITFQPLMWGAAAAAAEYLGGAMLVLGLYSRFFALLLTGVMGVAVSKCLLSENIAEHAFRNWMDDASFGVVFLTLLVCGAGRLSVDAATRAVKRKKRAAEQEAAQAAAQRPAEGAPSS